MKISIEQLAMLDVYAANSYISELVLHCKSVFPLVYQNWGERRLRINISKLINKATLSSVTQCGPMQLYFDMAITLGSEFETDPMYSDFSFKLEKFSFYSELDKSLAIYKIFNSYVENVIGEDSKHARDFINRLESEDFSTIKEDCFLFGICELLGGIYPQKYAFLGQGEMIELNSRGVDSAKNSNLSAKMMASYIMLIFVVGHGFEKDLFHLNNDILNVGYKDELLYISKAKEVVVSFINSLIL